MSAGRRPPYALTESWNAIFFEMSVTGLPLFFSNQDPIPACEIRQDSNFSKSFGFQQGHAFAPLPISDFQKYHTVRHQTIYRLAREMAD